MKNLKALWFTSGTGAVGIVTGEDETTGEIKACIGVATGISEQGDMAYIADWGVPIHAATLIEFLPKPPTKPYRD